MSPGPIIRRISLLKDLGIFRNYSSDSTLPDLQRYTLVYGFNCSGKSTLSRVFASLEAGHLQEKLPPNGQIEVELCDGARVKITGEPSPLKGRVLVFNEDFIEENLRWNQGTANPIFYLGKAQAELVDKLKATEAAIRELDPKVTEAVRDHVHKQNLFAECKRNAARLIAEELGLGRKYDATNLTNDYHEHSYDDSLQVPDEQRQQLRVIINQDAPLPKVDPIDETSFGLVASMGALQELLGTTLGTSVLKELQEHENMLRWVKEGLDYHEEYALSSCLFCGNALTEERKADLRQTVDDKMEQLIRSVATIKQNVEGFRDRAVALKNKIPSVNDMSKDLQAGFSDASTRSAEPLARLCQIVDMALPLVEKKAATPNIRIDCDSLPSLAEVQHLESELQRQISETNAFIEKHNRSHDEFSDTQVTTRKKLKEHFLSTGQSEYIRLREDAADAKSKMDAVKEQYKELAQEREVLRQKIREHGPAAEVINGLIWRYLGHKELQIVTMDDGYEIRRQGRPVSGSLSESEKTAIALCYFLSTLEAEGRQVEDLVIVIDDPISSLDTKALHYAFCLIKTALAKADQLIIMTHNLHFMNEVKKWLKPKAKKEPPTATLLFLDTVQKSDSEIRETAIKEMPALIRDYESEYQFLFRIVRKFQQSENAHTEYHYLMPNALRKVLDIFLAFKLPGSDGLASKVENISKSEYNLDPTRILALERLVQLESHADNLDDLVSISSMTIEETKDAANALVELMEELDAEHYKRLCKICD